MKRRHLVLASVSLPGLALSQAVPSRLAAPYYRSANFAAGAYQGWFAPRAAAFAADAKRLHEALLAGCIGPMVPLNRLLDLRQRWRHAALAWDRLASVAVGPLLARRSARQIDFWPIRPESIQRAIASAPRDLAALERIGTPAKGLGALEWLLWSGEQQLGQGACSYAVLLAAEMLDEARVLAGAYAELAGRDWNAEPQQADAAMSEIVNQWIGGLENLRWQRMERPSRGAEGRPPAYPRHASGTARASWSARWEALLALGVTPAGETLASPGIGVIPLEKFLRGRGLNALAARLTNGMGRADQAVGAADPANASQIAAAAGAITRTRQLVEAEVAPALNVQLGFSDSDGD